MKDSDGSMRCVGYDLLCNSLVEPGFRIFMKHDLEEHGPLRAHVRPECADGMEMTPEELETRAFSWVNDILFSDEMRANILNMAVAYLPLGALVATYRDPSPYLPRPLSIAEEVQNQVTSWDPKQTIWLLRKRKEHVHDEEL